MSKQRVLIIDDSPPIHLLIRARLSGEPVELVGVENGAAGLKLVREQSFDLVLLDVEMPQLSGFDVCGQLKSDPATASIPVIFLTGAATTEHKIKGLELGAVDYVTKPFDPAELRARVRAALRLKFLFDLLGRKAQIDGLTGLWNRQYFDARLLEYESLARRTGHPLACLMVDVDGFKSVNDTWGHSFGDEVLRAVASTLTDVVRMEDNVCRYGGEEFVLLLPNTSVSGAVTLAERIRERVADIALLRNAKPVTVTASIGVAGFDPTAGVSMTDRADAALYTAKRDGRNRVVADGACAPAVTASAA